MPLRGVKSLIFFCSIIAFTACQNKRTIHRAFYYWKSVFAIDTTEQKALTELSIEKLYVKFFDVTWNHQKLTTEPAAKIIFDTSGNTWFAKSGIQLIPVIFITNETFSNITADKVKGLADNIHQLLNTQLIANGTSDKVKEIQIDCDWTANTKDKYFELLRVLKSLPLFSNKTISATIRLYQCKYVSKTGVPPVDKGLLMCYNMGNLKDTRTNNSILETGELNKYINSLSEYSLPLDIALPLFSWKVLLRQNVYSGLMSDFPDTVLNDQRLFAKSGNRFEARLDTTINGYDVLQGDIIRNEESTYPEILKSIESISSKHATRDFTVSLYHLDAKTLSKFNNNELEIIYSSISN